jgi:hypothetical protein
MLTTAALSWVTRDWPASVLAVQAWLSALPVLVLVTTFATRSWRTRTAVGVVYLAIGVGLIPASGGLVRWGRIVIALAELDALLPTAGLLPLLVHRLRPLLAAFGAVILYLAAGILLEGLWLGGRDLTEVTSGMRWSVTRMIPASILAHVAGIVLFFWALRRRWLGRTLGALIVVVLFAGALDRLLQPSFPLGLIAVSIPGAILQLGLVWGAFKLLLWLQDRRILPAQILHFHLAVGFLTLLMGWTRSGPTPGASARAPPSPGWRSWPGPWPPSPCTWRCAASGPAVATDTSRGSSSFASSEARASASVSSTSWTIAGAVSVAWTSSAAPTCRSGR